MYFHFIVIIFPWKRAAPFILKKLESSSPKNALCPVVFEKNFFNLVKFFRYFVFIIHWERTLYLYKCEYHWTEDALCQVWWKLTQLFWRRRWKCEMFTNRRTDDGQQAIRKTHLSFAVDTVRIIFFFEGTFIMLFIVSTDSYKRPPPLKIMQA